MVYNERVSHNVAGLYIKRNKGVTLSAVAKAITASWTKRGGKVDKRDPRELESLGLAKTKRIGYAIVHTGTWIVVAESEQYTFDHAVAAHVAKSLKTECLWYALYGATDGGSAQRWGKQPEVVSGYGEVEDLLEDLPLAAQHYPDLIAYEAVEQLEDDIAVLGFTVDPERYDEGPIEDEPPIDPPAKTPKLRPAAIQTPITPVHMRPAAIRTPITPVRVRHGKELMLRDAFQLAFFLDGTGAKTKKTIAAAVDKFAASIPPDILRWSLIGYSSTTVRAFNSSTLARAKSDLAKQDVFFWLGSDDEPEKPQKEEPNTSAYLLRASANVDEKVSLLELRFASEYVWQVGVDAMVAFVVELAKQLPLVSGYGSLGLALHPMVTGFASQQWAAALPLAQRHAGYDLASNDPDGMGGLCRGARWLTILGPALAKKVKPALAKSGAELIAAGSNLVVRAGKEPLVDPDLRLLGKVAQAIKPVTLFGERYLGHHFADPKTGEHDPTAFARWEFRFLGGLDGAIKHYGGSKDHAQTLLAIRLAQQDYANAVKVFAMVEKLGIKDRDLGSELVELSELAVKQARGKEAIAWYTRWHEANDANVYTLQQLAALHKKFGDKAEGARLAAQLAKLTTKRAG